MKESFREGAVQSGKLAEHFKNPHCIIREVCNTEVLNVKNKQHMRILAELHVEIASLKRGGNETAALHLSRVSRSLANSTTKHICSSSLTRDL